MTELIMAMAAKVDGRVVLWEVDAAHPEGEVFIAGDGRAVQVAPTARVQKALADGVLLKMQTGDDTHSSDAKTPPPFEGYDALSAGQVVERLATLSPEEKAAVRTYEAAHKNRKTVLEALV